MPVRKSVGDEFGCYLVPGSVDVKPYYGKIEGRFCVQLAAGVSWDLQGIRVVEHGCPLFLLGADVMRGGRVTGWNFSGIRTHTPGPGVVTGFLEFEQGDKRASAELAFCPAAGGERFTSSMVSAVQGGLVGSLAEGSAVSAPQRV